MRDDQEQRKNALAAPQPNELVKSAQLVSRGLRDLRKTNRKQNEPEAVYWRQGATPEEDLQNFASYEQAARELRDPTEQADKIELEHYREIVFAFSDLMASHRPIIGDCALLPHPKATILYAIKFVVDDYETKRELATDPTLIESYDRMIPTLNYLFTCLARDWHDIAPEDKDAIARLARFESFPEWALPLKLKYIDEEQASNEAFDAWFRVFKDKVDREKATEPYVSE